MLAAGCQVVAMTVSMVVPLTVPMTAVIVTDPSATPVTTPVEGPTLASVGSLDDHVATVVTFTELLSEYVPIAVSWTVLVMPTDGALAVTIIDSNAAAPIFSVALPETLPDVAVMTVDPTATDVASPEAAFTVAVAGVPELQLTLLVKSVVLLSLNVPVALNCCVRPSGMPGAPGVTAIDSNPLTKDTRAVLVVPLTK
jgi:hypothetical protein